MQLLSANLAMQKWTCTMIIILLIIPNTTNSPVKHVRCLICNMWFGYYYMYVVLITLIILSCFWLCERQTTFLLLLLLFVLAELPIC